MDPKSLRDLDAAISITSRNLQAYFEGDPYAYLPVAGELRKLLCDGAKSLVLRIHPLTPFHAIRARRLPIDGPNVVLSIPGMMTFDGRKTGKLGNIFDEDGPLLPLASWIEQPLVNQRISIRDLIKSVADKEAAHSDRELNPTLAFMKSIRLDDATGSDSEFIASIGHYILRTLVVRRCVEIEEPLLKHYREVRAQQGPGALRLDLQAAQRPYSEGVSIEYKTVAEARATTSDAALADRAAKIMENHPDDGTIPLWVVDLQARVWFMQIGKRVVASKRAADSGACG